MFQPKEYGESSVLRPDLLLREARRQRGLPEGTVPDVCVLDPDGDIVGHLRAGGAATPDGSWACYHTTMETFALGDRTVGIVGGAVGAPFAVLVAEQLAASGCGLVISITSAGQVAPRTDLLHFVLIDRAWRDEGTSHHYIAPAPWSQISPSLLARLSDDFSPPDLDVRIGASWTTDAPYRETSTAIDRARAEGILAVEMEAAALYAYAEASGRDVVCFAHVTNTMVTAGDDFEKGPANGATAALSLVAATIERLRPVAGT